ARGVRLARARGVRRRPGRAAAARRGRGGGRAAGARTGGERAQRAPARGPPGGPATAVTGATAFRGRRYPVPGADPDVVAVPADPARGPGRRGGTEPQAA